MQILIYDNQIAGRADTADNLAAGFTAVEYDGTEPIELLYFDGEKIHVKPDQPSDQHYWAAGEWVEPTDNAMPVFEDWAGLLADLRGCGLLAKVYAAAKKNNKAGTAWTMMMASLTSPLLIVEDLAFAIADFRAMAPDTLDKEDCAMVLGFLIERGFHAECLKQSLE